MTRIEKEKSSRFYKQSKTKRKLGFGNWNVWITGKVWQTGSTRFGDDLPIGPIGSSQIWSVFFFWVNKIRA